MITSPNQQEDNALGRALSQRLPVNWEVAAYIVIFLLAVFTRFHMLEARVMSHDESLHTRFSYNLYNEGNFQHTPLMHGPVLFHATALSFYLFGDSDFSGRIYTALLGVIMVMFPLLLRKWLGRWGAVLASIMLLMSPLLLYYNRYIRHDTPSILFGMIMAYCILMYLDGSPRYRRRAFWLYLFAAAMILNLGSKETAFIYIAIFGSFLLIYFLVRLAQRRHHLRGKPIFHAIMLGILLGGVMTLGMYIVVDVIPAEILPGRGSSWADLSDLERSSWINWMAVSMLSAVFVLVSTALYAFRDRWKRIPWREVTVILLIAWVTAGSLLFIEELSHLSTPTETAEPPVPDADINDSGESNQGAAIRWAPGLAIWLIAVAAAVYLIRDARRAALSGNKLAEDKSEKVGLWAYLYQFPEVDFLVLIVTLILPWTTALFVHLMGGSSAAYAGLAETLPEGLYGLLTNLPNMGSASQIGQFLVGAFAFAPLVILSLAIGLTWHWKRWLVSAAVFHVIFAFFFTSVFTNIAGLGTGMIYSLGYWLEQQGVRRGSQPQYYYLLIILPTYEFLPIVGSVSAMFAGVTCYWKSRRERIIEREKSLREQVDEETGQDLENDSADDSAQTLERTSEETSAARSENAGDWPCGGRPTQPASFPTPAGMVGDTEPGWLFSRRGEDALARHTLDHTDDPDKRLVLWRPALAHQQVAVPVTRLAGAAAYARIHHQPGAGSRRLHRRRPALRWFGEGRAGAHLCLVGFSLPRGRSGLSAHASGALDDLDAYSADRRRDRLRHSQRLDLSGGLDGVLHQLRFADRVARLRACCPRRQVGAGRHRRDEPADD